MPRLVWWRVFVGKPRDRYDKKGITKMIRKDILGNEFEVECIGCALVNKTLTPIGGIIKETENYIF